MENIEVALRIRPLNNQEIERDDPEVWSIIHGNIISLQQDKIYDLMKYRKVNPGQKTTYQYNSCFSKESTNVQIYNNVLKRIALSSLEGINGTIFMYGQTGSGKTFTMMGSNHIHNSEKLLKGVDILDIDTTIDSNNLTENVLESTNKFTQRTNTFTQQNKKHFRPTASTDYFHDKKNEFNKRNKSPNQFRGFNKSIDKTPKHNNYHQQYNKTDRSSPKADGSHNVNNNNVIDLGSLIRSKKSPQAQENTNAANFFCQNHRQKLSDQDITQQSDQGNSEGLLKLALKDIFDEIEKQVDRRFYMRCSYVEIYTDQIYDLLKQQDELGEVLSIGEDFNKEFYIKGATEEIVTDFDEVLQKLKRGETNRHYASTIMNHTSSRSHTIFRLYVQSLPSGLETSNNLITESVLNFVDLAGSEKIEIHDNIRSKKREITNNSFGAALSSGLGSNGSMLNSVKDRVKESQHINKSLFFLTQVISLRSMGKSELYIPYRNSPLTKILRSSLGGNARTAIILCVSPTITQIEQTMSTLRFGANAKKIENKVSANIVTENNDETLKALIRDYEKKITDMEKERNNDKNRADSMAKLVESLQNQKQFLEQRLLNAKKTQFFKIENNPILAMIQEGNKKFEWSHIHYKDVGVLMVLQEQQDKKDVKQQYDFEGKYALQKLKNVKQSNIALQQKINEMNCKVEELQRQQEEMLKGQQQQEEKIQYQQNCMNDQNQKYIDLEREYSKLKQIVGLYQGQNPRGLQRLQISTLENLEKVQLQLYEEIKTQKLLKILVEQCGVHGQQQQQSQGVLEEQIRNMIQIKQQKVSSIYTQIVFNDEFFEENVVTNNTQQIQQQKVNIVLQCENNQQRDNNHNNSSNLGYYYNNKEKKNFLVELEQNEGLESKLQKLKGCYSKILDKIRGESIYSYKDINVQDPEDIFYLENTHKIYGSKQQTPKSQTSTIELNEDFINGYTLKNQILTEKGNVVDFNNKLH